MVKYKRILLKLSGETLGALRGAGSLDMRQINRAAKAVADVSKKMQVALVVGAGNIFRARFVSAAHMDRVAADHMGMMGTIINALALQGAFEGIGVDARVLSAIPMPEIMENYVHKRAIKHLTNKRIVILAGGTGRPYFTTDTAAVIRALEIGADVVLKASDVDGVYDKDPNRHRSAKRYETLTFTEALEKNLAIMDAAAFALARENKLHIVVFKFSPSNLKKLVEGKTVGTLITP